MPWQQLIFDSTRDAAPALEEALLESGALSVTLQDSADEPVLEPGVGERPLWRETRVVALFDADADIDIALLILAGQLGLTHETLPPFRHELLDDQPWERAWMDQFQPMRFGRRLWVCPSWSTIDEPDAVALRLDPGLAFGTGTHPTTALCLEWLDSQPLAGATVLDYGCGSGILAIAALLLGAERAIGVDNDPQALVATRDNAIRNGIAPERLLTCLPQQCPVDLQADVTVANILAGPLQQLAPQLIAQTRRGGRLALSGILTEQTEAVLQAYRADCDLETPAQREEWVRISGTRRA